MERRNIRSYREVELHDFNLLIRILQDKQLNDEELLETEFAHVYCQTFTC